jgi:hypothetical protein
LRDRCGFLWQNKSVLQNYSARAMKLFPLYLIDRQRFSLNRPVMAIKSTFSIHDDNQDKLPSRQDIRSQLLRICWVLTAANIMI